MENGFGRPSVYICVAALTGLLQVLAESAGTRAGRFGAGVLA